MLWSVKNANKKNENVTDLFGQQKRKRYFCIVKLEFFESMKYSELTAKLKAAGCYFLKHEGNHDRWYSPITGQEFIVARHKSHEVPKGTEKTIRRLAGI